MFGGQRIAVVVPALDEERLLPRVLDSMPSWVDRVIVVDDASVDATARVAAGAGGPVRVVRHAVNRGVGAAIATGYRAALDEGADVVAVMAADAQMDPGELWAIVGPVASGEAEYVKGDRLRHPEVRRRMPPVRRAGTWVLGHLTRVASGYRISDAQCGYTAVSAETLRRLPLERLYPRYGYPNDLLVMLGAAGARLTERVVTPVYGDERSGLRPRRALVTHSWVLLRAALYRWVLEPEPAHATQSGVSVAAPRRTGRAGRAGRSVASVG